MRGPVRLDAGGTHSLMTFSPVSDKSNANNRDLTRNRTCYSAARLSQAKSHTAGALWGDKRENVKAHWECSFGFILSEPTERCEDVYKVSRSFSEAVHTHIGNALLVLSYLSLQSVAKMSIKYPGHSQKL